MDARLRELERKWRGTGSLDDRMRHVYELERTGDKKGAVNEAREILLENPTYQLARDHVKRVNPLMWTGWLAYKQDDEGKIYVFEPGLQYTFDAKSADVSTLSDVGIISRNGELYIAEFLPRAGTRVLALSPRETRTLTEEEARVEVFGPLARPRNDSPFWRTVGRWEDARLERGSRYDTSAISEGESFFWDDQPLCFVEDQILLSSDETVDQNGTTGRVFFHKEEELIDSLIDARRAIPEWESLLVPETSRACTNQNRVRTHKDFCHLYFHEQGIQFTETDIRVLDMLRGLR